MKTPDYWNHNTAYYNWLKRQLTTCVSILDVGCGDGSLAAFLDDGSRKITGIDIDPSCIERALVNVKSPDIKFVCRDFKEYTSESKFDAIVFSASIHHMEMRSAIEKAKSMLSLNGSLLIVGIASPSTVTDYIIEILRIIPCKIISAAKHMKSSEVLSVPVSYSFPSMSEIRKTSAELLPDCTIKHGLFYRYLLKWVKR